MQLQAKGMPHVTPDCGLLSLIPKAALAMMRWLLVMPWSMVSACNLPAARGLEAAALAGMARCPIGGFLFLSR